jgi:hypothetical protein
MAGALGEKEVGGQGGCGQNRGGNADDYQGSEKCFF